MSTPISKEACAAVAVEICTGAECTARRATGTPGRPATAGHRLCPTCRDRLFAELRRLPELYEACGQRLDGGSHDPTRPKTSGGPLHVTPFNAQAAEVRTEILGVLGSWAGAVVAERGAPAPRRAALPLAAFLGRHLPWLTAHHAAGELSTEVARLVRRARRVVDPEIRHQVPIGACVEPDCPGTLSAVVRPRRPRLPAVIRCDHDATHRWQGREWLQLSRLLQGGAADDAPSARPAATPRAPDAGPVRWMTAGDIAQMWGISTGSAYRHASQARWRRRSRQGRTYYHSHDVEQTLSAPGDGRR